MDPDDPVTPEKNFKGTASWQFVKQLITTKFSLLQYPALKIGDRATNFEVIHLKDNDDLRNCNMLYFMKKGRPLVLNFGSCT